MAEHKRLGRGLAALIGDVGDEPAATPAASEAPRKPRKAPIEKLKPNPRNPRRSFTEAELEDLAASIKERGIIQPIVVREAGERFRDHRRRAALARGAARGPARGADRDRRGDRRAVARICDHRERAARRPQSDRGSGGLRRADGAVQPHAGAGGADRRQEPALCRQFRAAVEIARAGEGSWCARASSRPATRGCWSGIRRRSSIADMAVDEGFTVRQLEEWMREPEGQPGDAYDEAPAEADRARLRRQQAGDKDADTRALERRVSDALGLEVAIDAAAKAARCISSIAIWISWTRCCGSWRGSATAGKLEF